MPWLLPFGGLLALIGWVVGVILLLASPTWRVRDKLLGVVVLPGGSSVCSSCWGRPGGRNGHNGLHRPGDRPRRHHGKALHRQRFDAFLGSLLVAVALGAPIVIAIHLERVRRRAVV